MTLAEVVLGHHVRRPHRLRAVRRRRLRRGHLGPPRGRHPPRRPPARPVIEHAIGPVWEANHVWLIFVLVVLWTGFPAGFTPVASTLYVPLDARGLRDDRPRCGVRVPQEHHHAGPCARFLGAAFAVSSLVTPYFLGAVVGGVASGRVPPGIADRRRRDELGQPHLGARRRARRADLRLPRRGLPLPRRAARRAPRARGGVPAPGAGHRRGHRPRRARGPLRAAADAPQLADGLFGRALPVVALSVLAGLASIVLLVLRRYALARVTARSPSPRSSSVGPRPSTPTCCRRTSRSRTPRPGRPRLVAMLVTLVVGSCVLVPALVYLYRLFQRSERITP